MHHLVHVIIHELHSHPQVNRSMCCLVTSSGYICAHNAGISSALINLTNFLIKLVFLWYQLNQWPLKDDKN